MQFPPRIEQFVSAARVIGASLPLCALLLIETPVVDAATSASTVPTATRAHPTAGATFINNFSEDESISVVVSLKLRNSDELNTVVEGLLSPGSATYQQWLSDDELAATYLPTKNQVQAVVAYLGSNGFTNVIVADNNLLVTGSGTAKSIRSAFGTDMAHFSKGGRAAFANLSDVTVPTELSDIVQSVLGLQTLDIAEVATVQSLSPTLFPTVYDSTGLATASSTAVGIVSNGNLAQVLLDLHRFESNHSLPTLTPTIVTVGTTSSDTLNVIEWDLDSQVIQAAAGGTVPLTFYNGPDLTDATLTSVYNRVVSDNTVKILNVSLQQCETSAHSDGSMASDDSIFQVAVAHGQTVSVATGDFGAFQCGVGVLSVSYPASSPYVVAVGGTTLSTTATGGYISETAWSDGGGGSSAFEAQPSWQTSFVGGTTRALPDIAFDADPNSGAQIILNLSLATVGGTSLASPIFVGSFAKIQTHRSNALGLPAGGFYASGISGAPTAFHDVTSGNNGNYTATTGWDRATGWGSFDSINMDWVLGSIPATIGADFTDDCPSVQVTWSPVTGATAYRLYEEQGTLPWVGAGTLVYTGNTTSTLVSIPANINYLFKVSACNATVCSVVTSNTASGKRPQRCP